uniref:Prefoldin subunit 4 n=1 Tax=Dicentrarchus labrax TaxID=13489 RepID=A0A8P4KJ70_DICLA
MAATMKGPVAVEDVNVTFEDQQKINKFARNTSRMTELKNEIESKKKSLQNLQDASDDLMMFDDDALLIPYQIGDVFISHTQEETQEMLEAAKVSFFIPFFFLLCNHQTKMAVKMTVNTIISSLVLLNDQLLLIQKYNMSFVLLWGLSPPNNNKQSCEIVWAHGNCCLYHHCSQLLPVTIPSVFVVLPGAELSFY